MLLCEAYSIVIRAEAIYTSFAGGYPSFILNLWNDTCTIDGELVRMGFLSKEAMIAYGKFLIKNGLQASRDFTLFDMVRGSLIPCP
jgi:hypothetical protein